jgi:polysaccharide deacetylase family protein (PEP-CTERM system associated)
MPLNALSFDLEEWYHPDEIRKSRLVIHRHSQAVEATTSILDLLARYRVCATFFTVGEVGEAHPHLIERLLKDGHELAFHGWSHDPLWVMTPEDFTAEVERFLKWRDTVFPGVKILGFRAPTFSLDERTAWAISVLEQHGFVYDSSIFPARTPLYGVPNAPLTPYRISPDNLVPSVAPNQIGLLEIPMSVYPLAGMRIGFTGGLYLRALPWWGIKTLIARTNAAGRAAIIYIHPWETYAQTPRLPLSRWRQFILYAGMPSLGKLERLLQTFRFDSLQRVFLDSP